MRKQGARSQENLADCPYKRVGSPALLSLFSFSLGNAVKA